MYSRSGKDHLVSWLYNHGISFELARLLEKFCESQLTHVSSSKCRLKMEFFLESFRNGSAKHSSLKMNKEIGVTIVKTKGKGGETTDLDPFEAIQIIDWNPADEDSLVLWNSRTPWNFDFIVQVVENRSSYSVRWSSTSKGNVLSSWGRDATMSSNDSVSVVLFESNVNGDPSIPLPPTRTVIHFCLPFMASRTELSMLFIIGIREWVAIAFGLKTWKRWFHNQGGE